MDFNERHVEILLAATTLIAERGLKGASLRELARRVGISQPSLYHWFQSKDELVAQIIEYQTRLIFPEDSEIPPVPDLESLLRASMHHVVALYAQDDYVAFIQFLFAISLERREWMTTVRELFVEGFREPFAVIAQPLVDAGELHPDDVAYTGNLIAGPIILQMLNYRVLLREPFDAERWLPEIEFLTETLAVGLRARAKRPDPA